MRRLVLAIIAISLLLPVVFAEGPLYCDVQGQILNLDGSHASNSIVVKITIADTLGKASGNQFINMVSTKTGPPSTFYSGFYFTSFTQGQDCNYGEPVVIEATSGDLYGKTKSVLTNNPTKGQYDVILVKQTSSAASGGSNGLEGSSAPSATGNAISTNDQLLCEVSGFVNDEKTSAGVNGIPVTVILRDTKGEATGKLFTMQTITKSNPAGGAGYFYVMFGPGADCNVGEPVKIIAVNGSSSGETDSTIVYSPAKGQYDVLLKSSLANAKTTVQTNSSMILLTSIGLILLIIAIMLGMKRRRKFGQ